MIVNHTVWLIIDTWTLSMLELRMMLWLLWLCLPIDCLHGSQLGAMLTKVHIHCHLQHNADNSKMYSYWNHAETAYWTCSWILLCTENHQNTDLKQVSFDVKSLFNRVPVPEVMQVIKNRLVLDNTLDERTEMSPNTVCCFIELCTNHKYTRAQIYRHGLLISLRLDNTESITIIIDDILCTEC